MLFFDFDFAVTGQYIILNSTFRLLLNWHALCCCVAPNSLVCVIIDHSRVLYKQINICRIERLKNIMFARESAI